MVRWLSARTAGYGQIASTTTTHATIRTWLPCRTVTVTVPLTHVTALATLTDLLEAL